MSSQQRFFVLEDPLPATDIDSLLGRIVCSKTSPLDNFAPFPSPGVPSHDTNDIIPSILPVPNISAPFVNVVAHTAQRGIGTQLTALLKAELRSHEEQDLALECDELRRYMLPNPSVSFRELMTNEHYATDVRSILEKKWPQDAYLITGFLVAVNAKWKMNSARERSTGAEVTVPVAEPAGMPGVRSLDVGAGAGVSSGTKQHREATTTGEEIIAVSYSIAKLSYETSWTAAFLSKAPKIGRAVRAKPHHKSMGDEDEEILEWDSGDEDISGPDLGREQCFSHRPPTGVHIEDDPKAASDMHVMA